MSAPEFTVDVFQNEYLHDRSREVNAIVTVTSAGSDADGPGSQASAAEIIIVDCSASMGEPAAKMNQAREATAAAIDAIRDEVAFAVVAGNWRARLVYPKDGTLAMADERTKQAAKASLDRLHPYGGGTAPAQMCDGFPRKRFVKQCTIRFRGNAGSYQPRLHAQLAALPWREVPVARAQRERGHGRTERRTLKVTSVAAGLAFPHAAQAIQITRHRKLTGKSSRETCSANRLCRGPGGRRCQSALR